MAVACASVATPYWRWRCIGFTSFPLMPIRPAGQTMGLGTFYPPRVLREQAEGHDPLLQTRYRFGCSSPASWKTRVSCALVTAVLTNVHMCFPYPLPRPPSHVLLAGFIQLTLDLCACARVVYPWLRTTQLPEMHAQTRSLRSRSGFGERNKAPKAVPLCWPPGEAAAAVLYFVTVAFRQQKSLP